MAAVMLKCPTCGEPVEMGELTCRQCGTNLKSGESFDTQRKRAKSKEKHPEHYSTGIFFGVTVALSLIFFAGYRYQVSAENLFMEKPDVLVPPVLQLQEIDDLVNEGDYDKASKEANDLIDSLDKQAESIKPPEPYSPPEDERYHWKPQKPYNKAGVKRMLYNLEAKAERGLENIPGS